MLVTTHLFTPGPTHMPEAVRRAIDVPLQDHRAPDFHDLVLPLQEDLKKIFRTKDGEVLLFAGSGTSGWDASLANCLSPGDKVLTSSFGHFSDLWIAMCKQHKLEVEVIEGVWGEAAPIAAYAERLAADTNHEIKAVLTCHNETATGVTSDVAALRAAMDDANHPALLMVDGVSSIGALEFRMDDWGVQQKRRFTVSETLLDLKGLKCPLPVLKARKAMSRIPSGDRLVVLTTDPMAEIDIPHFCRENGHTLDRFLLAKGA